MIKELRLEVNKACNYACIHCYTDKHPFTPLSTQKIREILAEIAAGGATALSLTGGEPLLEWRRVREIATHARSFGLRVRLNSNGHLVTEEVASALAPLIDEFQISLNGADAASFDQFVKRDGAFEKVVAGIRRLIARDANVTARFTLMGPTAPQLVATFKLCKELGIRTLKVRAVVPAGAVLPASEQDLETMRRAAASLFAASANTSVDVRFSDGGAGIPFAPIAANIAEMPCMCGADALFVAADGKVAPCVFLRDNSAYHLGDVTTKKLQHIYDESDRLKAFIGEKADGCGNQCQHGCRAAELCAKEWDETKHARHQRLTLVGR